jgi:hypothetical protein
MGAGSSLHFGFLIHPQKDNPLELVKFSLWEPGCCHVHTDIGHLWKASPGKSPKELKTSVIFVFSFPIQVIQANSTGHYTLL